jgi:hypothetical protein
MNFETLVKAGNRQTVNEYLVITKTAKGLTLCSSQSDIEDPRMSHSM